MLAFCRPQMPTIRRGNDSANTLISCIPSWRLRSARWLVLACGASQHGFHRAGDVRAAAAEGEDEDVVTVECGRCAASLHCDTAAQSRMSHDDAQRRLATSTLSIHVRTTTLCNHPSYHTIRYDTIR